ncbi:hypothetical protein Mal15_41030 [Stieleria maiorica]|uniref:Uncharacterized protein n=1 Tax=Stieleria maiorica TaxID=2795974 RepID=A0A5B9MK37_9BACT|nr:hypothetical protein [Stieleria maiorica]QEG00035.1 hypothetical protein Mal15_41030 [Stieleria maiorica]
MAPFDECSVLLPSATLEDFPVGGSNSDARSLLAGWTILWHPRLLAQTEQLPTWYRADTPPNPDGPRVIVIPDPSLKQIPSDFRRKCDANPDCVWVTGADRAEMISALGEVLGIAPADPNCQPLQSGPRTLGVEDFFAAGYLSLQIQIMTRRLRYTSNLDELHLQNRIVAAAKAFCQRDAEAAAEGLHDVFDCLSEERDHYFSSDPHLVDLTLLTSGVLGTAIDAGWLDRFRASAGADSDADGLRGTPRNVLVDATAAAEIDAAKEDPGKHERFNKFVQLLSMETVGWAGGGIASQSSCLDAMTMASARHVIESGTALATRAIGRAPSVYATLSGLTPVDIIPALSALGYQGVIPIDFTAGIGFGDESKVIVSGGHRELEALTAKPIDAAGDAAFLSLGAHLGELIDSGEVATALLVHWPDRVCDSFLDLCRAATWSVAMGRFWTLPRYFTDGERPYHHGTLDALSKHSASSVVERLIGPTPDETLRSMAESFCLAVRSEAQSTLRSIAMLANPRLLDEADDADDRRLVSQAIGVAPASGETPGKHTLCFNPHAVATRRQARLHGGAPSGEKFVYAASGAGADCDVTFDVPAMGFTRLSATHAVKKKGLLKRLTGGETGIAEPAVLKNAFMAVALDETAGGISGVYSASRGNRLSMRLVAAGGLSGNQDGGTMVCSRMQVDQSDSTIGVITATGELRDNDGKAIAEFMLRYQLQRGSRLLRIDGQLKPKSDLRVASESEFWNRYFALRTAVAGEAAILRPLVRDKVHSASAKKMVAPLGVVIDEAEKQTLVVGHGLPLHRKVGDRFLDTLVAIPDGAERSEFQVTLAFDCPSPVAIARSCIAPAEVFAIDPPGTGSSGGQTGQAWLVHVSSSDVLVTEMQTARRRDGKLAVRMQVIQTRPKTSKVRLQFCAFAQSAFVADASGIERSLDELPDDVRCDDGVVVLSLGNHQAVDLVVVFDV